MNPLNFKYFNNKKEWRVEVSQETGREKERKQSTWEQWS